MTSVRHAQLLACSLLLTACTPAPQEPPAAVEAPAPTVAPVPLVAEASPFDTGSSIEDLMTALVAPNAEALWNAVSYVVTAEGATETLPQTDADWEKLRASAIALIEAGNMLMVPGRAILSGKESAESAGFQLSADEIAQLIAEDAQTWDAYAQRMQESTRLTLQAIELRDLMGLTEWGATINEACEACHAQYWYRPQAAPAL